MADWAVLINTSKNKSDIAPQLIILTKDATEIGRMVEIKISDSNAISRHHATIWRRKQQHSSSWSWFVTDATSLNGTYVGGRKIKTRGLSPYDEIAFGGNSVVSSIVRYTFFAPDVPVKISPSLKMFGGEHRECPVCMGKPVKPITLHCGHTFCEQCIDKWARTCEDEWKPCLCPVCRAKFSRSQLERDDSTDSIETVLSHSGVTRYEELNALSIDKVLSEEQRQVLMRLFRNLHRNDVRTVLSLVKGTIGDVYAASDETLEIMVKNMGGACEKESLREQALTLVLEFLYLQRENNMSRAVTPANGSCRMR